jgi:5'-3' exonuclease
MSDYTEELNTLKVEYFKGLQWVMLYYFHGCQDWRWYYPYYYAPFVSDLGNSKNLLELVDGRIVFENRPPYKPLE